MYIIEILRIKSLKKINDSPNFKNETKITINIKIDINSFISSFVSIALKFFNYSI
jgi:hypothetical protein